MKCYFLRHGIAVEPDEWQGRDFDRPLTPEGRERMQREAKHHRRFNARYQRRRDEPAGSRPPDCGDRRRSSRSARSASWKTTRLGLGFGLEAFAAIVAANGSVEALMLVGHEPSFSVTVGQLAGKARVEIKKGALAGVEFAGASATHGTLTCLIPPKALASLGKTRR